jgi:membrane protease YdiL (CAAX protease family)
VRTLRPLLFFFPLAFLLSWYPYILGKTHLVRTSGGMNPLGVMVAGIVAAAICYGSAGVKGLLGRYLRWRIGPGSYAFALLVPVGITSLAAGLNVLIGAARPNGAALATWPVMLPRFVFILLFIGMGEETGWRGFAFSPLAASIILGVIWAAWHIPLIGVEFQGWVIPAFLLGIMSASLLSTWLFNRSKGSLLPLPLFHATVNTYAAGYIFPMFKGADLTKLWWIYVILWMGAALLTLVSPLMISKPTLEVAQPAPERRLHRAAQ